MPKITRTFRFDKEIIKRFDAVASALGIDKTQILTDAIIKFVEGFEMRKIKEFTLVEMDNQVGSHYYSIQLDKNLYYAGYEETHIKTTNDIYFATRYPSKENAHSDINFIKTFFDENGKRK